MWLDADNIVQMSQLQVGCCRCLGVGKMLQLDVAAV